MKVKFKKVQLDDPQRRKHWFAFVQMLNPDIDPKAIRLMEEMRVVSHALYHIGESSLAATGLSYAQYRILLHLMFTEKIEGRADLSPSEISDRQGTSRNTVSALIRNLEEAGLVERHLNREDRRRFNICLTEDGRSLIRQYASNHLQMIAHCFNALDAAEQDMLSTLLTKVGRSLSKINE